MRENNDLLKILIKIDGGKISIVGGHHRLNVSFALGIKRVPCLILPGNRNAFIVKEGDNIFLEIDGEDSGFKFPKNCYMPQIKAIYDNGGQTVDRYTVILNEGDAIPPRVSCLVLSDNPDSPQGFSQYGECLEGEHLGKKISFENLPENVQEHIRKRLE